MSVQRRQAGQSGLSDDTAEQGDVAAALGGDGEAYARLVARHQQSIAAYMWRFTRNSGQWEELVQDVFVEAYLSLASYRARAPLIHWLRTIATRVGYRYWKRRARQRAEAVVSLQPWDKVAGRDAGPAAAREAADVLATVFDRLPPRDRLVLTLYYLEGYQVAEIAELVGWSTTMVKVQTHRARGRLRKLLEEGESQS